MNKIILKRFEHPSYGLCLKLHEGDQKIWRNAIGNIKTDDNSVLETKEKALYQLLRYVGIEHIDVV